MSASPTGTRAALWIFVSLAVLAGATANAATVTVCPGGCDHVTIQAAATAADPGDTIQVLSILPHTEADIVLTKDLTLEELGIYVTIIQAAETAGVAVAPVFVVASGAVVTMLDLTIRYGNYDYGGGIHIVDGHLTLDNSLVTDNHADGSGGGVYVDSTGTLTLESSDISSNEGWNGGGIYVQAGGVLVANDRGGDTPQLCCLLM